MAATITINVGLSLKDGTTKLDSPDSVLQTTETQTIQALDDKIVLVGQAAEEDLPIAADIATLGWCLLHNLDPTNYVQWGPKSAGVMVPVGRLAAGKRHVLKLEPGITIRWRANTGDCRVRVRIFND